MYKICVIIIFLAINNFAQTVEPFNFFPTDVGNVWQYMYDDGRFFQEKIFQDSIDNSGNIFLNFGPTLPMFHWSYKINAKKDSVFYLPCAINQLQYKFPLDSGEIFVGDMVRNLYGKVFDTYDQIIFGNITRTIEIRYYEGHPDSLNTGWVYTHIIAKNYGKIWYGDEVEYMSLIGCVINGDTSGIIFTDVNDNNPNILPSNIELYQNYPNPFNSTTTITYELSRRENIKLVVFDILGEEIKILAEGEFPQGNYKVSYYENVLPSGIYYYSLITSAQRITKKMVLLK